MKHSIFLLTFILYINTNSKGQSYTSILGDTATSWSLGWEIFDNYMVVSLKTDGDTVIYNHQFRKIVFEVSNQLFGFLREDTINGKAWFLYRLDTSEQLIMDLNLSLGDSFKINLEQWMPEFYSIVDSVFYLNNKKHIRFNSKINIAGRQENFTFIEGISSNAGFAFQTQNLSPSQNSHFLFCVSKDNISVFKNNLFNGDCFPLLGSIQKIKYNSISWTLYPNPFTDSAQLLFENPMFQNFKLLIIDQFGRTHDSYDNIKTGYVMINKNSLTEGLYYFYLISDNIIMTSGKLMIKN